MLDARKCSVVSTICSNLFSGVLFPLLRCVYLCSLCVCVDLMNNQMYRFHLSTSPIRLLCVNVERTREPKRMLGVQCACECVCVLINDDVLRKTVRFYTILWNVHSHSRITAATSESAQRLDMTLSESAQAFSWQFFFFTELFANLLFFDFALFYSQLSFVDLSELVRQWRC